MPPHIGILAPELRPTDGWGAYSLGLLRALLRTDMRLTVVGVRGDRADDIPLHGLLPAPSPIGRRLLVRLAAAYPAARAALAECDLIHALAEPYAPLAAAVAGSRPLITTGHGTYVQMGAWPFPLGALYRWAFRRGWMICVSRYTESVARARLPGLHTVVIPNGVDAARYMDIPRQPALQPTILTVGAIKARKGTRELVQALALVRERIPDARLIIVGTPDAEPGYAAAVRDDIARLGLSDAVTLTGRIPEAALRAHYAAAHVFALPSQHVGSKFEGYGLALIEASAAGLAVVGSRGCGAEDAVEDGVTGLLVPQRDPAALAAALIDLLSNPAQAAQMGAAGRIAAAARTWDAAAAHYRDHYLRLL